jgi:hypothetical protein
VKKDLQKFVKQELIDAFAQNDNSGSPPQSSGDKDKISSDNQSSVHTGVPLIPTTQPIEDFI